MQKYKSDLERQYQRDIEATNIRWEAKYNTLYQTAKIQIDNDRSHLQLSFDQLKLNYKILQQNLETEKSRFKSLCSNNQSNEIDYRRLELEPIIPGISKMDEMKLRNTPHEIRDEQILLDRKNIKMKGLLLDQSEEISLLRISNQNLENMIQILQNHVQDWESKISFANSEKDDAEKRLQKQIEDLKLKLSTDVKNPNLVNEKVRETIKHKDEEIESLEKKIQLIEGELKLINDQQDKFSTLFQNKMSEEISNHSKAEEQKKKLNLQKRLLEKELVTSREKEERNKKEQFHFQTDRRSIQSNTKI